jgi:hypothetical protein
MAYEFSYFWVPILLQHERTSRCWSVCQAYKPLCHVCEHKISASNLHTLCTSFSGLYPAYFLIKKYITQWEKYGLHFSIGHWLVNSWTGEPNSVPPSPTSPQCTACEMAGKREGYNQPRLLRVDIRTYVRNLY